MLKPDQKTTPPIGERIICWIFGAAYWIHHKGITHPKITRVAVSVAVGAVATGVIYIAEITLNHRFEWWQKLPVSVLFGAIIAPTLLNGFFPPLRYAKQWKNLKNIGLEEAYCTNFDYAKVIEQELRRHDSKAVVRVICVDGKKLFQDIESPLFDMASRARLQVLLPSPDPANPTIKARASSYKQTPPEQILMCSEMAEGTKKALKFLEDRGNRVTFHNILCMWRVIILSETCIVQPYFPARAGETPYDEPLVIFRKQETGVGFYHTFLEMFEKVSINQPLPS